jgi:hypothetical protein
MLALWTMKTPEFHGRHVDFTVISPTNRLDGELVDGYRELGVGRLIVLPGLDVPTERRYHAVPIEDIFRTIDHVAALRQAN